MTDYTELQNRCQRGEASLAGANNLLAECHAALGRLIVENEVLLDGMTRIMHAARLGEPAFAIACEVVGELSSSAMDKEETS